MVRASEMRFRRAPAARRSRQILVEPGLEHGARWPAHGHRSIDLSGQRDPSHSISPRNRPIMARPSRRVRLADETMSAMQQRRNDMATKRSKRASKTSAARSKRKVRARATPPERRAQPKGVINAWQDDPGAGAQPSGGEVIQRPVPELRAQPFATRIAHPASAPDAKPHPVGRAHV